MEKWLVISNCQTFGFANSIQSQVKDVQVTGVDTILFQSDPERFNKEMIQYSKLFISPGIADQLSMAEFYNIEDHVALPVITCRAFHPDLVYLEHDNALVTGPVGDYHSAIAFACFQAGMTVSETLHHFSGALFERFGYMAMWLPERDRIIDDMSRFGIDVSAGIRRWGRSGAFMHSINHPRIHVLYDIASNLLAAQGKKPIEGVIPHDNLMLGAVFAVYPEIGEALGVHGSYLFKNVGNYTPIELADFVAGCFGNYEKFPRGTIQPHPEFRRQVDYIATLI